MSGRSRFLHVAADQRARARFVDLQLDLVRYKSGTPIARYGGRWDRRARCYVGDAPRSMVVELHAQQVEAAELFDRWLEEYLHGEFDAWHDEIREVVENATEVPVEWDLGVHELLLTGGRRSGKTTVAEVLGIAGSVAIVDAIVWTVTPNEGHHEEPREVLAAAMPAEWYVYLGWPHFTFTLANGSQHILRSGHKPGNLKKGRADLVIVNEAQQVRPESYENARGGTIDLGGLVITAANPPRVGDHRWIVGAVEATQDGKRAAARHLHVNPFDNPRVNRAMLLAERSKMTAYDFATQIEGKILSVPNAAFYAWDRRNNERSAPDFGRITSEFLAEVEGGRELEQLWSIDVQSYPFIAAARWEVYRDPFTAEITDAPEGERSGLLWAVDEIALERADEVDVAAEIKRRGADPAKTMIVLDATQFWQQMIRSQTRQRDEYKGKSSAFMLKACGFDYVVRPDRKMRNNPDVDDRYRAANARIGLASGVRRLFADPMKCPTLCESVRTLGTDERGRAKKDVRAAHFGDVVGYAVWRFFPRRTTGKHYPIQIIPREAS